MDFFEAQENARHRTSRLVVFYLIAVVLIVAGVYLAAVLILHFAAGEKPPPLVLWQPDLLGIVAVGVLVLVAAGSLFKTASLKSGGGAVARLLGGRQVAPNTTRPEERRLVNVVEEMAIASGVRIPEIYVLPEEGINAFAAGFSTDDAAVAVTEGCLKTLNRDQLQGVIAHEFSHILNGDMRLNIRLIGLLFGILLLAITGQILLRSTFYSGGRRRDSKSGGAVMVIALIGLALILIGYIGVFFGRLIQSAVSRQREFLADASAVQFTRNPGGLVGALKRIGAHASGSVLRNNHATEASHLFFANGLQSSFMSLFATHPPLVERIRAIDPSFNGDFGTIEAPGSDRPDPAQPASPGRRKTGVAAVDRDQFITRVGMMAGLTLATAADALGSISPEIRNAARDPESSRVLVLALLLDRNPSVRDRQITVVTNHLGAQLSHRATQTVALTEGLGREERLTVLDLALPTLKSLPVSERPVFHQVIDDLIHANREVSLFEFAVQQLLRRYVPLNPQPGKPRLPDFYAIKPLAEDIALLLATLADSAHHGNPEMAARAYQAGADRMDDVKTLPKPEVTGLQADQVAAALEHLSRASLPICKRILDACVQTAGFDGTIEASEIELLRAISATLDCPIPPVG
ncbi:MAG: M48 family metallopeptidase [Opitutaceae bacterium]